MCAKSLTGCVSSRSLVVPSPPLPPSLPLFLAPLIPPSLPSFLLPLSDPSTCRQSLNQPASQSASHSSRSPNKPTEQRRKTLLSRDKGGNGDNGGGGQDGGRRNQADERTKGRKDGRTDGQEERDRREREERRDTDGLAPSLPLPPSNKS